MKHPKFFLLSIHDIHFSNRAHKFLYPHAFVIADTIVCS